MAYSSWSVVFGETPSAAKWNILGTNDAYFDSLVGSGTAWTSYTPTWTNVTVGNATQASAYQQFGKTVIYKVQFTWGTTTSQSGNATVSLPITANANYLIRVNAIGELRDTSATSSWPTFVRIASTTTATLLYLDSSAVPTLASVTPAAPATWASTDVWNFILIYEAA